MAGAEIVVVNFWRIDLSIPNHVNDSCGGFGPNQQFFDTETVFAIPSHHQTYPKLAMNRITVRSVAAVTGLFGLSTTLSAILSHRSREKHG
jgi:hypothetical protein